MKIRCTCENIIVDQSDYLKYKGYIISDTQWIEFWDAIDDEIDKNAPPKGEQETIQLSLQNLFKITWECVNCGRLFIESKNGDLLGYAPENKEYNRVLDKEE